VHGGQTNRIAAADYAMPTIVSTVQEIELPQLARWECMCVHVYFSLQQKALDALLPASSNLVQMQLINSA
jgi:hypothetical protein